jgi:threonylcarbamoyladenosine tRNA methylthiotransferase MtaB
VVTVAHRLGEPAAGPTPAPTLRCRAFLKVQDGCDHRCTYCSVWRARGGVSRSLDLAAVHARAEAALQAGHRELILCGVDLGAYGRDLEPRSSLAAVVRSLLGEVGEARLRLSSVNANDVSEELASLTAHPRLCSHWHMPLQSGSDAVLRAMHRGYRSAQYRRVAGWVREADPKTELTTDVMVAFPGETDADHRATVDLVEELELLDCHVFRWSPRQGTPAAGLPDRVDDAEARRRSRAVRVAAARSGLLRRRRRIGSEVEVLWERVADGEARGISAGYHSVVASAGRQTAQGRLSRANVVGVEGERLRATVKGW